MATLRRRDAFWAAALLLLASIHVAGAVNYIHDEVLWTKQRWHEFMLDFPVSWPAASCSH